MRIPAPESSTAAFSRALAPTLSRRHSPNLPPHYPHLPSSRRRCSSTSCNCKLLANSTSKHTIPHETPLAAAWWLRRSEQVASAPSHPYSQLNTSLTSLSLRLATICRPVLSLPQTERSRPSYSHTCRTTTKDSVSARIQSTTPRTAGHTGPAQTSS